MSTAFHRLAIALSISCTLLVLVHAQTTPDQVQDTFRSAVDVVTIQASVRDARGRVVQGLTRLDFEVRDNGRLRPIIEFRSDRQSPVTLAILVDMSGSMGIGPKIAMARQAYESVLSQLRPSDEAALFTFDSSLHERQGFTQDLSRLRDGLSDFEPFGDHVAVRRDRGRGSPPCGPVRDTSRDGGVDRRDRHEQPSDGAGSVGTRGLHRRPGLYRGNRALRRSTRDDGGCGARRAVRVPRIFAIWLNGPADDCNSPAR